MNIESKMKEQDGVIGGILGRVKRRQIDMATAMPSLLLCLDEVRSLSPELLRPDEVQGMSLSKVDLARIRALETSIVRRVWAFVTAYYQEHERHVNAELFFKKIIPLGTLFFEEVNCQAGSHHTIDEIKDVIIKQVCLGNGRRTWLMMTTKIVPYMDALPTARWWS